MFRASSRRFTLCSPRARELAAPSGHASQSSRAVAPAASRNVPAGQASHVAVRAVPLNVPGPHASQAVAPLRLKLPRGQSSHVAALKAPTALLAVPAAQGTHSKVSVYVPSSQGSHAPTGTQRVRLKTSFSSPVPPSPPRTRISRPTTAAAWFRRTGHSASSMACTQESPSVEDVQTSARYLCRARLRVAIGPSTDRGARKASRFTLRCSMFA